MIHDMLMSRWNWGLFCTLCLLGPSLCVAKWSLWCLSGLVVVVDLHIGPISDETMDWSFTQVAEHVIPMHTIPCTTLLCYLGWNPNINNREIIYLGYLLFTAGEPSSTERHYDKVELWTDWVHMVTTLASLSPEQISWWPQFAVFYVSSVLVSGN